MNFLTDAQLRLMGHDPDTCDCDLCWPPNTDPGDPGDMGRQARRESRPMTDISDDYEDWDYPDFEREEYERRAALPLIGRLVYDMRESFWRYTWRLRWRPLSARWLALTGRAIEPDEPPF